MGNSKSLFVKDIVEADVDEDDGAAGPPVKDISELKMALESKFGVTVVDDDQLDQLQECWRRVNMKTFWQKHAAMHPNYSRVKMWLWVHQRYRDSMKALLEAAKEESFDKTKQLMKKIEGKVVGHSQFEDEQLFKFFQENLKDDQELIDALAKLNDQHHHVNEASIATQLEQAKKITPDLLATIESYCAEMHQHLNLEEQTLLHRWMNLSDKQYATYRTYLSWKYAPMY